MSPQPVAELERRRRRCASARRENETLYAVIKTVSSSLDLDRVLRGIVDIATDATGCHACFIYFLEGERLVLRAASPQYRQLLGKRRARGSTRGSRAGSPATRPPSSSPRTRWPTSA